MGTPCIFTVRPRSAITIGDHFTEVWNQELGSIEEVEHGDDSTMSTKVPGNWASFIRVDKNKQELSVELVKNLKLLQTPVKQLFTTILDDCWRWCSSALRRYTCDEADTRIFLNVAASVFVGNLCSDWTNKGECCCCCCRYLNIRCSRFLPNLAIFFVTRACLRWKM